MRKKKPKEDDDNAMPEIDFSTWKIIRRGPVRGRRLALATLRAACGLTQSQTAKRAKIAQSDVSRAETRNDCLVSTLARYAKALDGELELFIKIDGRPYPIALG